jgi:hypothetical protein
MSYPTTITDVYTCTTSGAATGYGAAVATTSDFSGLAVLDVVALVGANDVLCARVMWSLVRRGGGGVTIAGKQVVYSHCTDGLFLAYDIDLTETSGVVIATLTGQTGYNVDWDTKLVVFYTDEV